MTDRRQYMHNYYLLQVQPLAPLLCPCGCGQMFTPRTRQQMYFDRVHKCRVHNRIRRMKRRRGNA